VAGEGEEQEKGSLLGIIEGAIKNPMVAVVLIGSLLVALGALGAIPKLGPFTDPRWGYFLAALGVVIVGTGLWNFSRTRHETNGSVAVKKYGIRILSPQNNARVNRKIRVEGSYKKMPPTGSMTIVEKSPSTSRYWFKKQTPEFDTDKKLWWFSDVYVGGEQDSERVLYLAIVGDSGKALLDYYFLVREKFNEPLGVETLPRDISRCAQVFVRRAESDPPPVIKIEKRTVPAEGYSMRITEPRQGSLVGTRILLRGTYERMPPEGDLVIYERTMDDGLYWFKQEIPVFDVMRKQWSAEIYIGNEEGTVRTLYIGMLGETGKAFRSYFQAVHDEGGQWVGLKNISPDVEPLAEVNVTYSARAKLRTR
jgi:hypothetical protein